MSATENPISLIVANTPAHYRKPASPAVPWRRLAVLVLVLAGFAVAIYPQTVVAALAAGALLVLAYQQLSRLGLETWQFLSLCCVTGYVVLNYGFENLSLPLGPLRYLPVAELLMGTAWILALRRYRGLELNRALNMPAVLCILALLLLTFIHLVTDLPQNGLYALRDSTSSVDALFLVLGVLWATEQSNLQLVRKWLLWLFILATVYSFTFPWAEQMRDWSPSFGPFHAVPLIGNYQELAIFLFAGALYSLWVAPSIVAWPRWVFRALAIAQLAGLAILQSRTTLVGIVLIVSLLILLHDRNSLSKLLATIGYSLCALVLVILILSVAGWQVQGRLGPMDISNLANQVKSIWPTSAESRQLGHESDRQAWYGEVWNKVTDSPAKLLVGVGYGQPLVDFMSDNGQPIRQPHNSSLTFLGRLGLIGLLVWFLFLFTLLRQLGRAVIRARKLPARSGPLPLWFLAFAILGLLDSMVQPYFEFSHSAVPFFFLAGIGLGNATRTASARTRSYLRPSGLRSRQARRYRRRVLL